jgi:hypothetical protein
LVLSTAQRQIKHVQERVREAVKMTKGVRAEMRQFARDTEARSIDALRRCAERKARAVSTRHSHLHKINNNININNSNHPSSPSNNNNKQRLTVVGLVTTSSMSGAKKRRETVVPGNSLADQYDLQAEANAAKATSLAKARARAMAIAAEALVSADVWMEIRQQEARLKMEESLMWKTAAMAVQRAWKRWASNRWKRKLQRLDNECQQKVIWEIQRAKEAAIAAAILSKVGGSGAEEQESSTQENKTESQLVTLATPDEMGTLAASDSIAEAVSSDESETDGSCDDEGEDMYQVEGGDQTCGLSPGGGTRLPSEYSDVSAPNSNANISTVSSLTDDELSYTSLENGEDALSTQRQATLLHYINPAVFNAHTSNRPQSTPPNSRSLMALNRVSRDGLVHATATHRALLDEAKKFHRKFPDGFAVLPPPMDITRKSKVRRQFTYIGFCFVRLFVHPFILSIFFILLVKY